MTWHATMSGHISGTETTQRESEAKMLEQLRALVTELRTTSGYTVSSATVSTQYHGYVDLIGPQNPDQL